VPVSNEVRWGIVGPGFIAGLFAEDLARVVGARCVAVASRDAERARGFAERFGIDRHYADYAALAADPGIDVVYIATPHSHHFAHAKMMLEAGKSVMVEKPFTMNGDEAEELIALARRRGVFLMDAMWTLCNPLLLDLAKRVRAGEIGTPRGFNASLGPLGGIPAGHRVEDPALGGSFLLECLVYPLNILAALAPDLLKADKIHASSIVSARGVDTYTSVMLTSEAGVASMSGGFVVGSEGAALSTVHLAGGSGWLQIDDNLFNPGHAVLSSQGAAPVVLEDARSAERYRWEIEEANRCLRAGELESPLVPHALTLDVMRVLDRCRSAAGLRT
jgi:predicted dehydrogenase